MNSAIHEPLVSILMGVYNAEKYLHLAMESLLAQTWQDFELIIVNDGSTDRSGSVLEDYASRDHRIRVITQQNEGLGRALSKGLEFARGKYIARMDADDLSYPQRLERQLSYMQAHPDVIALGTGVNLVDPEGILIHELPIETQHEDIDENLLKGNGGIICHPSVMFRHDALIKVGGYDSRWPVAQDLDLFLRLAETGRVANLPEVLIDWRQHLESANHAMRERQIKMASLILEEAYARRGLHFDPAMMSKRPYISPALKLQRWGWNALSKGYRKQALLYALKLLRAMPFSWQGYKLLACAVRGR